MKTLIWIAAAELVIIATASSAYAQGRPLTGASTPAFSPYLNLVRPGSNPALNYYGLVRPQIDFARSMQGLQGQLYNTQDALMDQSVAADGLATGHPVSFMNYGAYFLTTSPGRSGSAVVPPRAPAGPGGQFGRATTYRR